MQIIANAKTGPLAPFVATSSLILKLMYCIKSDDPLIEAGGFKISGAVENINLKKKGSVPSETSEKTIDRTVNKK
jgi:hypothetical protein